MLLEVLCNITAHLVLVCNLCTCECLLNLPVPISCNKSEICLLLLINHVADTLFFIMYVISGQARGGAIGRPRGGASGGGRRPAARGRGRGRGRGEKVSAEDLDADLEKYHSEAMETN